MLKLLPCPFCGGKRPKLFSQEPADVFTKPLTIYVQCTKVECGAKGPSFEQWSAHHIPDPTYQAFIAWNKRA